MAHQFAGICDLRKLVGLFAFTSNPAIDDLLLIQPLYKLEIGLCMNITASSWTYNISCKRIN